MCGAGGFGDELMEEVGAGSAAADGSEKGDVDDLDFGLGAVDEDVAGGLGLEMEDVVVGAGNWAA